MKKSFGEYFKRDFLSDFKAGFITSIVALPLAIAFSIASGVPPIMGLYTAIIAGILGAVFGGSNFSITGPTGAMSVIILSTVTKFGIEGLLLAGLLAGVLQMLFGIIKIGRLVKYIPLPVIVGFTGGIGAIIFFGQMGNFFGMPLVPKEKIWETLIEMVQSFSQINSVAILISILTILALLFLPMLLNKSKRLRDIPPSIIALIVSSIAVFALSLNVPVVGAIPSGLPRFQMINFSIDLLLKVLPAAFTIALLGSIEALLCAVVCDAMTDTKHKSDKELFGQGVANFVLPFFGGIPATAAIARSAVNIREGARTKVSAIIHSIVLLLVILFFAPLAMYIPKAFLAGVLMVVSIRMINFNEVKMILATGKYEALVMVITFILTILTDLVFAVQVGMLMAIFLLFVRLTKIIDIRNMEEYDTKGEINKIILSDKKLRDKVAVYTIHGPFFFGAMNVFEQKIEEHMHADRQYIIIRMKHVPFVDGSGLVQLIGFLEDRKKRNSRVIFTEFWPRVGKELLKNKEFRKLVSKKDIFPTVNRALEEIRKREREK